MEVWGLVLTHTELGNKILPLSFLHVLKYYSKIPDVLSLCVCAYVHSAAIWNCLRNLVCVCSIWVPFHVCLLFVWFFSGHRNNLPQMSQCTRQSNSSKFASFSCAVFVFVLPAAYFKLDMSNLSLFQVKIFNFSSLKKVGK